MLTRMRLRRAGGPQTAITDVYDERRGTFLVQYPVWLIIGLGLAGVVAFAVTGFADAPVVMYIWLCALVVALQASIFRNRLMRARLIATLVVTAISIIAVAFLTFKFLPDIIAHFTSGGTSGPGGPGAGTSLARALESSVWTYTVINFGLLAIFWVDTIRRWVRRAMGLSPTSRVVLTPDEERQEAVRAAQDMPSLEELVSGDLIAGAVLTIALSFVLDAAILGHFIPAVASDGCIVSLPAPFGHCTSATVIGSTSTLTFIDRIQALIYFPLGLIILALTAVLSGLGAAGGVTATHAHPAVERAVTTSKSSQAIAEDVTTTVLKTLRSAVDRRLRHLVRNLALSLRTVAWPALILLAIFGLSQFSLDLAAYLGSNKSPDNALNTLKVMGPGVLWGAGAALAVAFSAALFVFRWRVADNTLRFMGLIGFVLLLTFWLFSGALAGFNLLLGQVGVVNLDKTQPFLPPGLTTYASLAALVIWGAIALVRRSRAGTAAAASGAELVGANVEVPAATGEPPSRL